MPMSAEGRVQSGPLRVAMFSNVSLAHHSLRYMIARAGYHRFPKTKRHNAFQHQRAELGMPSPPRDS